MIIRATVCLAALGLDALLGEPVRGHPLVGFGRLAGGLESRLNRQGCGGRLTGLFAVLLLVLPAVALSALAVVWLPLAGVLLIETVGLYFAIGMSSLTEHARAVARPLQAGQLDEARSRVGRMVSRDVTALDEEGVSKAATESVLENGADAVFASLFWYLVGGLPGVVLHRLVNTLDAMWGYRNPRFECFGWAAARLDDVLGWIPARLTALAYGLCGRTRRALVCWFHQAGDWPSPNAGPVMAAGAGGLGLRLGGPAPYHGGTRDRPTLGEGESPGATAPDRAVALVRRAVMLWLGVIVTGAMAWHWITAVA